jgi:putative addiction module CopG family antidote
MASSVDLGNQLESVISQLVKAGRFNSRSEVLREGVRLVHEREVRLAALMLPSSMASQTPMPDASTTSMTWRRVSTPPAGLTTPNEGGPDGRSAQRPRARRRLHRTG